jgi:cyanophycinase
MVLGLLGSGEFEPWAEEVDRWLLARTPAGEGSVLILPTASAPEGDSVFERWGDMGLVHYRRIGVSAEVLPLKTKEDADREDLAERLRGASMAFFSGGNAAYLADVLSGSRFWHALLAAMDRGMAYAGCSAGVAGLGERAPDNSTRSWLGADSWQPGLRLFHRTLFGVHWDALDRYVPGLRASIVASIPPGHRLLAIDEKTAVVGDGSSWTVMGSGGAYLLEDGEWSEHRAGSSFPADMGTDAARRPPSPSSPPPLEAILPPPPGAIRTAQRPDIRGRPPPQPRGDRGPS